LHLVGLPTHTSTL
jgi:hypothetical protein